MKSCRKAVTEFEEAIRVNLYYGDAYFSLGLALLKNALMQELLCRKKPACLPVFSHAPSIT